MTKTARVASLFALGLMSLGIAATQGCSPSKGHELEGTTQQADTVDDSGADTGDDGDTASAGDLDGSTCRHSTLRASLIYANDDAGTTFEDDDTRYFANPFRVVVP